MLAQLGGLFFALIAACEPGRSVEPLASEGSRVVYDTDDRRELFDAPTPTLREFGEHSVVALISNGTSSDAGLGDPSMVFDAPTWAERRKLCDGVRFATQPAAATCSGVLIERDLVLTAGHCARNLDCGALHVVFGYHYAEDGVIPVLEADDVYRCREVVSFEVPNELGSVDYGWLRLDRPVSGDKRPAPIARVAEPLRDGQIVHAFEFGGGIPLKLQPNMRVTEPRPEPLDFFVAALDAFEGSSGGPLIDESGRVVGIIGSGNADYVETFEGCLDISVLPETAAAEVGTYAFQAAAGLCSDAPESGRWCDQADHPSSCAVGKKRGGSFLFSLVPLLVLAFFRRRSRHLVRRVSEVTIALHQGADGAEGRERSTRGRTWRSQLPGRALARNIGVIQPLCKVAGDPDRMAEEEVAVVVPELEAAVREHRDALQLHARSELFGGERLLVVLEP
jgi:hypothetical protein